MKEYVLQQKRAVVDEIKEKIQKADAIVLMEYRGLTVEHATDLRNKFRQANVDYKVYKNTMMEFAFKDTGFEGFAQFLQGPNAVAFSPAGDPVSAAKVSVDFAKEHESLQIKAGIVDGKIIDKAEVKRLA